MRSPDTITQHSTTRRELLDLPSPQSPIPARKCRKLVDGHPPTPKSRRTHHPGPRPRCLDFTRLCDSPHDLDFRTWQPTPTLSLLLSDFYSIFLLFLFFYFLQFYLTTTLTTSWLTDPRDSYFLFRFYFILSVLNYTSPLLGFYFWIYLFIIFMLT